MSRPLRALEKAGVITLTRVASAQGYVDAEADPAALRPEDDACRDDPRLQRAGNGAADRDDRAARPRGRRALPGRRGPVGGRGSHRPAMRRRSTCSPSPVTRPSTDRPARVPFMSARERTARSGPGGRGEPAATRRARPSPSLYALLPRRRHAQRAGRRRPGRRASPGSWSGARTTCGITRSAYCSRSSTGWSRPRAGGSPAAGTRRPTSALSR